ncbi:MAG: PQQ-binding-like beta-propeller repeat protein, partial [Planctomycetota bacterium]|nr:PQQ-binding-like beta-propeller repeat protein [Planctomycetota bacterium]
MNAAVKSWTVDGKNQLWKSPIGGRTTPILLGDRLFFNTVAGEGDCLGERVVCLDPDTGGLIWEHKFNVYLTTIVEARVAWTSVVGDPSTKYVYAHGTGGMFYCFDFDGDIVWRRSLTEFYNRVSGYGGRVHTPIVDGDNVIISFLSSNWGSHGKPGHRYVAFDKMNGAVVWWSQPGGKPLD